MGSGFRGLGYSFRFSVFRVLKTPFLGPAESGTIAPPAICAASGQGVRNRDQQPHQRLLRVPRSGLWVPGFHPGQYL